MAASAPSLRDLKVHVSGLTPLYVALSDVAPADILASSEH